MGKCRTSVSVSVFCNARGSMELRYDEEYFGDNAVSLYYLEIPHFTLVEEAKVFKNNVRDICSASPKLCIFFVLKISCAPICTMSLAYFIHLFNVFYFFTISWQLGFLGVFACYTLCIQHINEYTYKKLFKNCVSGIKNTK
jgi:hypothetical protein